MRCFKRSVTTVVCVLAAGSLLAQAPIHVVKWTGYNDYFGKSVAGVGDLDQDGRTDVAVATIDSVVVLSGKTASALLTIPIGDVPGRIAAAGDVDGDGVPDIIVGIPDEGPGSFGPGAVAIFSGATGALIGKFPGITQDIWFGFDVDGVGDIDLDGVPDLVAGSPYSVSGGGVARVLSGKTLAVLYQYYGQGAMTSFEYDDHLGWSVAGGGDVDLDGVQDFAYGMVESGSSFPGKGRVKVHSGANGTVLRTLYGAYGGEEFGTALCLPGDLDGDGYTDVAVGSISKAAAYSGQSGAKLFEHAGKTRRLKAAGDIDNDGVMDLILCVDPYTVATIVSGTGSPVLFKFESNGDNSDADGAGDVNGDGNADFVVGQGLMFGDNTGTVWIFSGTCGAALAYGAGCKGSTGHVPFLELDGCTTLGGLLKLSVGRGLPQQSALLLFGMNKASVPLPNGCTLLVQPVAPFTLPVSLDPTGSGSIAGVLPHSAAAGTFTVQAFTSDPTRPGGYAASNGLEIVIP